ncbi:lipase domain-containing protein [Phthorimaea operculella]|nr:lipase domain-containing protein [Phthorimaea operculella]
MYFSIYFMISLSTFVASKTALTRDVDVFPENMYGITWMYFPDGDGIPRLISLEMPPAEFFRSSLDRGFGEIEYRLYTKYNKENYVILDDTAIPVNTSTDPRILENLRNNPVKIVTHGWESSGDRSAVIGIKDAYLNTSYSQNYNVIGVDWGSIAESILYPIVALRTTTVGNSVGSFIDALSDRYQIPAARIHLIGHSLGAHVMGNAGEASKLSVGRITGLDPARPLFEFPAELSKSVRLDPSDGQFVDVIHTCRKVLGVTQPSGNADFYPNSGYAPQPGCTDPSALFEACSHSRSHQLFADSIRRPKSFPAYSCSDWSDFESGKCNVSTTFLGEKANRSAYGSFYLETNANVPYGRGYTE